MQVIRDALKSADLPYGSVVTIGNYDGIHRGQLSVINKAVQQARQDGVDATVISFEPHPLKVLRPETAPPLLTSDSQRRNLLEKAGVDFLLLFRFGPELAHTPAEDFVRQVLSERMAIKAVYVGADFVFGHQRGGDLALLQRLGQSLDFIAEGVDEAAHQGEVISSTRIRRTVLEGEVELAMDLLGRPYSLLGKVVRGDRMGMRLGWPTINLDPENEMIPADGVYAGQVFFPSFPATFDCVTNVGTRPTVYENYQQVVESHILGFNADVYGEAAEISFHKRLREEKIFSTVMDLSAQISRDVESTREYFAAQRRLHPEEAG
jgi:riboflavin kinase/FMN adenylyltransferase